MPIGPVVFLAVVLLEALLLILLFVAPAPVYVIGGVLTLIAGAFILMDPRAIPYVITFVTFTFHDDPIGRQYVVRLLGINWYAMDWILLFGWLSWMIRRVQGVDPPRQANPVTIPLAVFLLSLPFFSLVGIVNGNRLQDAFSDLRLFFYYVSFFSVVIFVRDWDELERLLWTMIICGTAGAIHEIIASLTQTTYDALSGRLLLFRRITGAQEINYPLQLIASLALIPFVTDWRRRLGLFASIVVSTLALYLSYARGSWLAAFAGGAATFILLLWSGRLPRRYVGRIVLAVGGFAMVTATFLISGIIDAGAFVSRATLVSGTRIDISSLQRLTEITLAFRTFLAHPIFGAGLGLWYRFYAIGVGEVKQLYLHNSYFFVLSKMGAVGFALLAWLYWTVILVTGKIVRRVSSVRQLGLAAAFSSMVFVLLVKSTTTWYLNTLTTSMYVGLILGLVGVMYSWVNAGQR